MISFIMFKIFTEIMWFVSGVQQDDSVIHVHK